MSTHSDELILTAFDKAFPDLFKLRPSERRRILLEKLDYLVKQDEIAIEHNVMSRLV